MSGPSAKPYHLPGHLVMKEPRLRFGSKDPRDLIFIPCEVF